MSKKNPDKKKPTSAKNDNLSYLPPVIQEQIKLLAFDLVAFTNIGRSAIARAVLIGIRVFWLKATLPHGQFLPTLSLPAFQPYNVKTLQRYSLIARQYLEDKKIKIEADVGAEMDSVRKKDVAALTELLQPKATEATLAKLEQWADGRSMTDILRALAEEKRALPPVPSGSRPRSDSEQLELNLFTKNWTGFKRGLEAKLFLDADEEVMLEMHSTLKVALGTLEQKLKNMNLL